MVLYTHRPRLQGYSHQCLHSVSKGPSQNATCYPKTTIIVPVPQNALACLSCSHCTLTSVLFFGVCFSDLSCPFSNHSQISFWISFQSQPNNAVDLTLNHTLQHLESNQLLNFSLNTILQVKCRYPTPSVSALQTSYQQGATGEYQQPSV